MSSPETGPPLDDTLDAWDQDAYASFAEPDDATLEADYEPQLEEVQQMLKLLVGGSTASQDEPQPLEPAASPAPNSADASTAPQAGSIRPATLGTIEDAELIDAFVQDASRGLAILDQAVIDIESGVKLEEAEAAIGRELHTLKGAAATVGLSDVGRYLHEVEDCVQAAQGQSIVDHVGLLLNCIDTVRTQVSHLTRPAESDTSEPTERLDVSDHADDTITVRASQLDRLLDMLSALVMLRNQRESRVEQLRLVHDEIAHCGSRLREVERRINTDIERGLAELCVTDHSNPLNEVGNDLLEIRRNLQSLYEPVADENVAVSNFIRQFRQALVTMLRMPVSGLFRRLQRAALDAARVEEKRVQLKIAGSDVGLERSVQERLFDPLLHIIRNAVGHGIESPEQRRQAGKDPVGTITLEATGTPNLLVLTIRDDGRGLDYEALRQRGVQQGLLSEDAQPTNQELAQLIFQRGFSTRETTNEVAGRGIGMDVVAETLNRMQAWVDVESQPQQGTTITLTIPLRSIIEHVMVFRTGGQLFALPMPALLSSEDTSSETTSPVSLSDVLGIASNADGVQDTLVLETHGRQTGGIRLQIDALLGPEEIVVRPLPPLLRFQPLFSGVTLSGKGEIVLVLDPVTLSDACHRGHTGSIRSTHETPRSALIVDDSLSARRAAAKMWSSHGYRTVEAVDGPAALQQLSAESFDLIVTDYDMPGMNGVALIEQIRQLPTATDTPIVMLSSRRAEEIQNQAVSAGASAYLQKPISEEKIQSILHTLNEQFEDATP